MSKLFAQLLIEIAMRLLDRNSKREAVNHIRTTVKIADFPDEMADAMIARGIAPHAAAVLFRDALKRPPC